MHFTVCSNKYYQSKQCPAGCNCCQLQWRAPCDGYCNVLTYVTCAICMPLSQNIDIEIYIWPLKINMCDEKVCVLLSSGWTGICSFSMCHISFVKAWMHRQTSLWIDIRDHHMEKEEGQCQVTDGWQDDKLAQRLAGSRSA